MLKLVCVFSVPDRNSKFMAGSTGLKSLKLQVG